MRFPRPLHRLFLHRLVWLGVLALAFTLAWGMVGPHLALGWMQNSPPPTPTPTYPPTPTPLPTPTQSPSTPTTAPTQAPTATAALPPTATFTPALPPTATATPVVIPPTLPPAATQPPPTPAPPATPTLAAPVLPPGITPSPEASPTLTPGQPITNTSTSPNPENLINLIDTFVLYSAYFLLGLGIIFVILLAIFLYYLNQRAKTLKGDNPSSPDEGA